MTYYEFSFLYKFKKKEEKKTKILLFLLIDNIFNIFLSIYGNLINKLLFLKKKYKNTNSYNLSFNVFNFLNLSEKIFFMQI